MSCKNPSDNMKKMYAARRTASLNKVQTAIDKIKEDGREVTKKELIALTGLSSAAFSQPHIKELLKKNEVCQFNPKRKEQLTRNQKTIQDLYYRNRQLETQLNQLTEQCQTLSKQYDLMFSLIQSITANTTANNHHISFAGR